MVQPTEEQAVLDNAVAGDRAALQQLLLVHFETIDAAVRGNFDKELAVKIDPQDVVQEVLIKVHRHIGSYRREEGGGFKAWLRRIAANCVVDAARRCQRQKRGGDAVHVQPGPADSDHSWDTLLDWVWRDSELPEKAVRQAEARQALQVCLSQLDSAQREAVVAHYFDHLDTGEIAARMGRSPGAVRELLRRGRQRLQELMGTASTWLSSR